MQDKAQETLVHAPSAQPAAGRPERRRGRDGGSARGRQLATVALFAEGHLLIEDNPGVGKTLLARALAKSLDLPFQRVQCTADLLPADILGGHPEAGALDNDLRIACLRALDASRSGARKLAESFTWGAATQQFLQNVMQANGIALAAE